MNKQLTIWLDIIIQLYSVLLSTSYAVDSSVRFAKLNC